MFCAIFIFKTRSRKICIFHIKENQQIELSLLVFLSPILQPVEIL